MNKKLSAWPLRVATLLSALLLAATAHGQQTLSSTRTSAFSYHANGLLASETIEPDTPALCVRTSYTYYYGNRDTVITENCAGATGLALFQARQTTSNFAALTGRIGNLNGPSVTIPAGTFAGQSSVLAATGVSHTEQRTFDPRFGEPVQVVGPNGTALATQWELDDFGRKVLEKRADGTQTRVAHCLIVGRVSDTSSNSPECASITPGAEVPVDAVRFEHSHAESTLAQTNPVVAAGAKIGRYTRTYYDAAGRKVRVATEAFDGPDQPASARGAVIVQDTRYSAHGAVLVSTQPYFLTSGTSLAAGGSSGDYGRSLTDYDALGRPTRIYTADPQTSATSTAGAQAGGREASVNFGAPLGPAGFVGPQVPVVLRAAVTTITYSGLETTTTDDKWRTRKEEKTPDGKLLRATDATGAQLAHQYDALGNLIETRDALGNRIKVAYDIRGNKIRLEDPDSGITDYCHDALGQLRAQQTANQRAGTGALQGCGALNALVGADLTVAFTAAGWTTLAYDRLGRQTQRLSPEYRTTWRHDKGANGANCVAAGVSVTTIGRLCESTTSTGITTRHAYNGKGQLVATRRDVTGGPSMASGWAYDGLGRLQTQTYPTGLRVRHAYTPLGWLHRLSNDTVINSPGSSLGAGSLLWRALQINAWGKVDQERYINGVVSRSVHQATSGRLLGLTAGTDASPQAAVHQRLNWDSVSQLTSRVDERGNDQGVAILDSYSYDSLGRLTEYQVSGNGTPAARTVKLQYNALGMLLWKSDVGIYTYAAQGGARPHAVQSITGPSHTASYRYDAVGNAVSATGGKWRTIGYTSFNLPDGSSPGSPGLQGPGGSPTYRWQYDENQQRIKEMRSNAQGTRTTWYWHPDNKGGLGFERQEQAGSNASNRHYIGAAGAAFMLVVTEGALPAPAGTSVAGPALASPMTAVRVDFWHKDHLGSLIATTNAAGQVLARYSYDPFGKRRNTNGTYDEFGNLVIDFGSSATGVDRGFTGHEHLDDVGLIHMNGRVFDPLIGRFMQADPFVQEPGNLQNYDRYVYCFNAPLICTDPTGYLSFKKLLRMAVAIAISVYMPQFILSNWGTLTALSTSAAGIANGVVAYTATSNFAAAAISGFFSGAVGSGSVKGGLQGAFSAGMFFGAGEIISGAGSAAGAVTNEFAQVAIHGVTGCITSAAGGGRCGSGALSAAFSKTLAVTGMVDTRDPLAGAVKSAVAGGVGSVLGGGKFANGAMTGAFSYLFNECMHTRMCGMEQGGYSARDRFETPSGVDIAANEQLATEIGKLGPAGRLVAFRNMVDYGAPWDYKTLGAQYENFGNYHYGYMGAAAGLTEDQLFRAAGFVQRANSGWFGEKPSLGGAMFGYGGTRFFGDDPKDASFIRRGIDAYRTKQAAKNGG